MGVVLVCSTLLWVWSCLPPPQNIDTERLAEGDTSSGDTSLADSVQESCGNLRESLDHVVCLLGRLALAWRVMEAGMGVELGDSLKTFLRDQVRVHIHTCTDSHSHMYIVWYIYVSFSYSLIVLSIHIYMHSPIHSYMHIPILPYPFSHMLILPYSRTGD